ncbi:MAG: hypothetical protein U9R48_07730 [Chloroflexota bacterium]|nr:hypothetical protein [Chloroflexota bacterium]
MSERTGARTTAAVTLAPSVDASIAVICGVISSGRFVWSEAQILRLWVVWLIVDIILGLILAQWRTLKAVNLQQVLGDGEGHPRGLIPYSVSGSPGAHLAQAMNRVVSQWQDAVWPLAGRAALTAILGAVLALAMATFLGREILGLVAFGLVFGVGLIVVCREREVLSRWLHFLQVSLAWLAGGRALGPLAMPAVGLALLMGLGAYAREGFETGERSGFFRLVWVTNWSLVLTLLLSQQPVLAVVVGVTSLAEAMSRGESGVKAGLPLLHNVGWFVSMFIAALAVTRW